MQISRPYFGQTQNLLSATLGSPYSAFSYISFDRRCLGHVTCRSSERKSYVTWG
ncbi:hypothetical protein COCMIDRAFT_111340 [Bipolaris oryzae ATCC 44560]|uniref:Uncharacterized protein n=1 Tax=Bipolaris oryzae ATCC 44560 TaxID=930090 RepID=W6YVJ0_COCMI|nr:uncharacterized protein COCMIDRAFT_111340 [Bipolaris oryzae ATCC 44560]EUC39524.1 hypothetical protein COCMIDRAFT_111340 [Bipolaris oryzae ATCC 44560]